MCLLVYFFWTEQGRDCFLSLSNGFQIRFSSMAGHDIKADVMACPPSTTPSPSLPLLHSPPTLLFVPLFLSLATLSSLCCPLFHHSPLSPSSALSFPPRVPFAPWGGTSTAASIQEQASTVETRLNNTDPVRFPHWAGWWWGERGFMSLHISTCQRTNDFK